MLIVRGRGETRRFGRKRRALSAILADSSLRRRVLHTIGMPASAREHAIEGAIERALSRGAIELRTHRVRLAPLELPADRSEASSEPRDEVGTHWIEIELLDMAGEPMPGEAYEIRTGDGNRVRGRLDGNGRARVDGMRSTAPCEVTFPELDQDAWRAG